MAGKGTKGKPKGSDKTGGRKKGTPNKKPQLKPLRIQLAELNFNLAQAIMDLLSTTKDDNIKIKAIELLAKYSNVAPQVETYKDPDEEEDEAEEDDDTDNLLKVVTN